MQKIMMPAEETKNFLEVFEMFVISQSAKGIADVTIRNYRYHMKNIGNYMNLDRPFDDVTKRDIETMAAAMRRSEMAHNSIATYMRMLRTFYNWCNAEGFSTLAVPAFKEKETVKDTYNGTPNDAIKLCYGRNVDKKLLKVVQVCSGKY